jgi:hypothetical protein
MGQNGAYRYLGPKRGSKYQQLFVNGRIMAEVLYRETVGINPLTPEQVAGEYDLPVEAVLESIHYCTQHPEVLEADRTRETALIEADGRNRWPYAAKNHAPAK